MRFLLLLSLADCTHLCVTRCGMTAYGLSCPALQEAETRALDAFSQHKIIPKDEACHLLRGWRVRVHAPTAYDTAPFLISCNAPKRSGCRQQCDTWRGTGEVSDSCLLGYTYVEQRMMEVAEPYLPQSSLAHEMLHALDFERKMPLGHCMWTERQRKKAIFEATSLPDDSAEPCH